MSARSMALVALLMVVGCAADAEPSAPQVPAFEGQLPIVAEVTYWSSAALDARQVDDGAAMLAKMGFGLTRVANATDAQITLHVQDNHTGGCIDRTWDAYEQNCGEIYICQRALDMGHFRAGMAAHEISHALGMPHVPDADGPALMNAYESPRVADFTDADAAGFQTLRAASAGVFAGRCAK